MIDDTCDYCRREFGREPGAAAICVNCGLENVRSITKPTQRETAAFAGAPENAMNPRFPFRMKLDATGVSLSSGMGKVTTETIQPRRRKKRR